LLFIAFFSYYSCGIWILKWEYSLKKIFGHVGFCVLKKLICFIFAFLKQFIISQPFDRVWHDGLLFKLKHFLPLPYYLIIISYLENRSFSFRHKNNNSTLKYIKAGVPQGSDLSPILYNNFTDDIPTSNQILLASFADDTPMITSNKFSTIAPNYTITFKIEYWAKNWKIKINDEK